MLTELANSPTFHYWFICLFILYLKMFANSAVQGIYRVRNNAYTRPEDAVFFGKGSTPKPEDLPIVQRASACWRNDLENIPIFLIIGLAFAIADGPSTAALLYFGLFTLARIAHTILYLRPTQPWRNFAYDLGVLITMSTAIHTGYLLFLN